MSALAPIVDFLTRFKIPRALAIAITYVVIFSVLGTLIYIVINPLTEQTLNLAQTLPKTIEKALPPGSIDKSFLQQELTSFSRNALTFTVGIFNNFITIISIAVLTFYLLLERGKLDHLVSQFFIGKEEKVVSIVKKVEDKLGSWLRGQILLSLIIGTLAYIVLLILNVPYALPLAILAGLMEVVPVIGPIISAIPAILVAYLSSPALALMVAGSYFVIQQLENHLIVPQVMKKAVGLNPLIVILAVAVGGRLLGIAGALLAVPITVVLQIVTEDILIEEKA